MSCLSRVLDSVKAIQKRLRAGLPPEAVSIERDAYANRLLFACDAAIRNSQRGRAIVIYLGQPDCSQEVSGKVLGGRVLIEGQAVWIRAGDFVGAGLVSPVAPLEALISGCAVGRLYAGVDLPPSPDPSSNSAWTSRSRASTMSWHTQPAWHFSSQRPSGGER